MITELPQDWGNRLLEGTNETLCARGERQCSPTPASCSPQETEPDLPMSVQESVVEVWVDSLALSQTTDREHSPAHQQKVGLKIC